MAFSDPVSSKLLGSLFGDTLDPYSAFGDKRVYDYYNKYADSIYSEATAGQYFDAEKGGLVGGKDIVQTTLERMQKDPETASLFQAPSFKASGAAGGQQTPDHSTTTTPAPAVLTPPAVDLAGENKNLTIAGGSADAANSSTVDDGGKKKRSPTGLASSLGINV